MPEDPSGGIPESGVAMDDPLSFSDQVERDLRAELAKANANVARLQKILERYEIPEQFPGLTETRHIPKQAQVGPTNGR